MKYKIAAAVLFGALCSHANAKTAKSLDELLKKDVSEVNKCETSNYYLFENDTKLKALVELKLRSGFGAVSLKDFDMGECITRKNFEDGVFYTSFWQKNNKIAGIKNDMLIAYDINTESMLILIKNEVDQTFVLDDFIKDKQLFSKVESSEFLKSLDTKFDFKSKLKFSDYGDFDKKSKNSISINETNVDQVNEDIKQCNYNGLPGKEYKIADQHKKYLTNDFYKFPDKLKYEQYDASLLSELQYSNFKVTGSDVATKESSRYKSGSEYMRFDEEIVDRVPYWIDQSKPVQIVTPKCNYYYMDSGTRFSILQYTIQRSDGNEISKDDFFKILGNAIFPAKIKASTAFDDFNKTLTIRTDSFNRVLIRGLVLKNQKNLSFAQVYTDLTFFGDWGFINSARDRNGNAHEVTRIDNDVDCKNTVGNGCRITETVGIGVSEEFLRKNRQGFDLKLYGKKSVVIGVTGEMVKAFLGELDKLRK